MWNLPSLLSTSSEEAMVLTASDCLLIDRLVTPDLIDMNVGLMYAADEFQIVISAEVHQQRNWLFILDFVDPNTKQPTLISNDQRYIRNVTRAGRNVNPPNRYNENA